MNEATGELTSNAACVSSTKPISDRAVAVRGGEADGVRVRCVDSGKQEQLTADLGHVRDRESESFFHQNRKTRRRAARLRCTETQTFQILRGKKCWSTLRFLFIYQFITGTVIFLCAAFVAYMQYRGRRLSVSTVCTGPAHCTQYVLRMSLIFRRHSGHFFIFFTSGAHVAQRQRCTSSESACITRMCRS
jgi:hypothetical protein